MTRTRRSVLLVVRWFLLVIAAIAGYMLGQGSWYLSLIFGAPWIVASVTIFYLVHRERDGLPQRVIVDGIFKGIILCALLATIHAGGGYHKIPLLSWSIVAAGLLILLCQFVLIPRQCIEEDELPLLTECIVVSILLAWPIEATVFVVTNSCPYQLTGLTKHQASLSIAGLFFAVMVAVFQALISYVKGTWLHQSVRSLAQGHVTKTRLTELQKHLHEELRNDRIDTVQCYHSTSLLYGFWLNPLAQAEKDISVLTYALHNCTGGPTFVELIGPSPTGLEYLITSRVLLLMKLSADGRGLTKARKESWQKFLEEIVSDVGTQFEAAAQHLKVDHLRNSDSQEWWQMLDVLRWYLLSKYYTRLQGFYKSDHIGTSRHVSIRECTRYDEIIPQSLGPLFQNPPQPATVIPNLPFPTAPVWHLGPLVQLQAKSGDLLDAMAQIDQIFFPEYAFALLSPRDQDVRAGLRAKVLLCHNILGSLSFARFFSQPPSILRLMNDEFVEHYSQAFLREMHPEDNQAKSQITTVSLALDQCQDRWNRLATHAWQSLEALMRCDEDSHKEVAQNGTND